MQKAGPFLVVLATATLATLAALAATGACVAQTTYPSAPITVIVPFAAGGSVDVAARIVLPKLSERLKQAVVIENAPGAAGTIGTQRAIRARPDGYTLLFAVASPITVAPQVAPATVRYDALRQLAPIAPVGVAPFVLIGKPGLAAASTADLVKLAKSQPGKLSYGTDGAADFFRRWRQPGKKRQPESGHRDPACEIRRCLRARHRGARWRLHGEGSDRVRHRADGEPGARHAAQ